MLSQLRQSRGDSGEYESSEDLLGLPHPVAATVRGMQGGLVATCIMTAFRLPILRSLPPSANFWATYVGNGNPDDYPVIGLFLHLLYGTMSGAIFGTLFALHDAERSIEAEQRGLVWGWVYGMALSAFGSQIMLKELLDIRLEADELALFHASHAIYGLSLGAWVGSRAEGVDEPAEEYEYESGESESIVDRLLGGNF